MQNSEIYKLYAETQRFKDKVARAKDVICNAFSKNDKWYCSFSTGKDSTVTWHLSGCIDAIYRDNRFYLPESQEYVDRLKKDGFNIVQLEGQSKHTDWFSAQGKESMSMYVEGYEGVFLGLRKDENSYRRVHLNHLGNLYFSKKDRYSKNGCWHCSPIADWTVQDVWAYIISNELDYNKAYDKMNDAGIDLEKQRIGPYANERALGYGQIAILKKCWPQEFNRFVAIYQQAGSYV